MGIRERIVELAAKGLGIGSPINWSPPAPPSKSDLTHGRVVVDPSRVLTTSVFTPYNPSVLVSRKGLKVFDQMRQDEAVKSSLVFKKVAALSAGWEIVSPSDQEADWEVTTFVRDALKAYPGGFHSALRSVLTALDYGFSVCEKVYGDGSGELEGKLILRRLVELKPHYLDFATDASGELQAVIQMPMIGMGSTQGMGSRNTSDYPPEKFVVFTYQKMAENLYGTSDLEAAYRAWWLKDNAYKWLAVLLERYGVPPLFALYDQNAYIGSSVDELKKVIRTIQNATLGLIPRNKPESLELWSQDLVAGSQELFLASIAKFDADIAKALLQPSLTGFAQESGARGAQSGGSMARANVSFNSFMIVVAELQRDVAESAINNQLIKQLCDLNFPNLRSYPTFQFLRTDDESETAIFELWSQLVLGKVVNRIEDDEAHIRKSLGFPENPDPKIEELPDPSTLLGDNAPGPDSAYKPKKPAGKPVPDEQQTKEMREFAEANDGTWVELADGTLVCLASGWDESQHPRAPAGDGHGGEFVPKGDVYHVTETKNVASIKKKGIQPFRPSNWIKAGDKSRYGGGGAYAFENELDAQRWAARMDWAKHQDTGTGRVSILRIKPTAGAWRIDDADPLSQAGSKGRWLTRVGGVAPVHIGEHYAVGVEHIRKATASLWRKA